MKVIDLSHTISPDMPVFPGTQPPIFKVPVSIDIDGYLEKKMTLFSHTGTHVDAPAHMIKEAATLDQMAINQFTGNGFIIDVSDFKYLSITKDYLINFQDKFEGNDFVLIHSGWSDYWGNDNYFKDYPVLDQEAANWISQFNIKGIGIDMISVDTIDSTEHINHKILLDKGFIIVENLNNLKYLKNNSFTFYCFPLKITSADGAPTRAVAILP